MRFAILSAGLILALAIPAAARRPDPTPDAALAGRIPGKPVTCISQPLIDDSETFPSGAILYRMRGGPDYLNQLPHCAGILQSDSLIVTRTPSTDLCRGDIVEVRESTSPISHGSCPLGDFVPAPRLRKPRR